MASNTVLSSHATEKSTYVIPVAFFDEATPPAAVTPTSATWTLMDELGGVINSRSNVTITPATTANIVLTGNDLQLTANVSVTRFVLVAWVYTSSYGSGLTGKATVQFTVDPLVGVS